LGEDRLDVLQTLSNLTGAAGRFDQVHSATGIIGIVDYAHTPDALLNVLATIRKFLKGGEQLITVVGCGGDRDRSKRPLMAQAAAEFSTRAIFTSDNPRSEDPSAILQEMNAGLDALQLRKVLTIADRREAIRAAIMMANAGDIVLVAGKGHENYQEVNGVKYPFDDREVLENIFNNLEK
jgi:UDP-N-acetylmuramoyl-L-alanyl-D-glutamate--2,6-diaminopimelate ligase